MSGDRAWQFNSLHESRLDTFDDIEIKSQLQEANHGEYVPSDCNRNVM
jgi:hypothetical protein